MSTAGATPSPEEERRPPKNNSLLLENEHKLLDGCLREEDRGSYLRAVGLAGLLESPDGMPLEMIGEQAVTGRLVREGRDR